MYVCITHFAGMLAPYAVLDLSALLGVSGCWLGDFFKVQFMHEPI
jgi:hypothetical protein